MNKPFITDADWFGREHRFHLYPTRDVKREYTQRRKQYGPPSEAALIGDLQIISGDIQDHYVQGDPDTTPRRGQTLIVVFEDAEGGQSELRLAYKRRGRSAGWTDPVLHPSTTLQNADNYTWGAPQEIVDFEFI